MGSGMAWDCSVGVLCSFGGKDHYEATGGLTQGCGAQAGLGILFHYGDDTVYDGGYEDGPIRASAITTCPTAAATSASWSITAATAPSAAGPSNTATSSGAPPAVS